MSPKTITGNANTSNTLVAIVTQTFMDVIFPMTKKHFPMYGNNVKHSGYFKSKKNC